LTGPAPASRRPAGAEQGRLAAVVFALLVLACFAAFFVIQRVKHTPTVLQRFELTASFTPAAAGTGAGVGAEEHISFKLSHADQVTVTIINSAGDTVATLVRDRPLERYKQFSLRWNGHEGSAQLYRTIYTSHGHPILLPVNQGRLAPAGEYRVRVAIRRQDRTVLSPRNFILMRGA
jgi:hypothetical protein